LADLGTLSVCKIPFLEVFEANRIAADQQVRRKAVTGRQTEHNLSHLDGIADLFTPIRFQSLGNSADRRLILREEFGGVLVRAS
jgi:hypothetical protein